MTNNNENKTPISYRQYYKALLATLKRNLHIKILYVIISPENFTLYLALNRKHNIIWFPKIITYNKETRKVHMLDYIGDFNPVIIDAATFLYMDETKVTI